VILIYNREKAIEYARKYWNEYNNKYYNFDKLGGDCTNFVSQILNYAGIVQSVKRDGWYYKNVYSRSPSWSASNKLYKYLKENNIGYEVQRDEIEVGDIIFLSFKSQEKYTHSLVVVKKEANKIYIATHSDNAFNRDLDTYPYKFIKYFHIN